ncbi:hypothetical protein [Lactovum odontotermitis]
MKRLKLWIVILIFAGIGMSLAFSRPVSAADPGNIYFYINIPGGSFDRSSLQTPSDNPDLMRPDSIGIDNNQEYVWRQVKDKKRSKIGRIPKMIGRAGYTLYNQQWNTNPEVGGTLYIGFESSTYFSLFSNKSDGNLYLLWQVNDRDRLTLTYDSNSDGEVANPADLPGKIAGEKFSAAELPVLKRHGYLFDAWHAGNGNKVGSSRSSDGSVKTTPVEADPSIYDGTDQNAKLVTSTFPLKAEWQKKSGNVTVELLDTDGTIYRSIDIDIWGQFSPGLALVRPGYSLTGWKTPDGDILAPMNESRTPASMDINLSPGGTLKLYAQWKAQSTLTISYKDRDLNEIGIPSSTETQDTGTDWTWNSSYEKPVTNEVLAAYRINGGNIIEGKPSTISLTQDTTLDLIYGQDKAREHGAPGSDGKEDFNIERSWEREDGSSVSSQLTAKTVAWNKEENFTEKYDVDCDSTQFKGFEYLGYYLNHDKNTFHSGENTGFPISGKSQITYVFRQKVYDLKVHYVDFKGKTLTPGEKTLPQELADSQDYIIDPTKLDNFDGQTPTGWYLGAPKSSAPSLAEINDMTKAINVTENEKTEIEITVVYDDTLKVTLPLSMKFRVSNHTTKAVTSTDYAIKNESSSSKLLLKLDPKTDVVIGKNPAGIRLLSREKTDSSKAEELFLTLKSDQAGFGEYPLDSSEPAISEELDKGQSIHLTFAGKYYGDLPDEKSPVKEFEGKLIWHFAAE